MQVAIFADTHLVKEDPQRFVVLEWTLSDVRERGIEVVIIAGDFCQEAPFPYDMIRETFAHYKDLKIYILIGNHDLKAGQLSSKYIALDHVFVVDKPMLLPRAENVLLLPYENGTSMARKLFALKEKFNLRPNEWVLISHGDLMYGDEYYEDEGYFPITPADLRMFSPAVALLGHIHSGPQYPELNVFYCGSLYPISTNETGPRRYALLDTDSAKVEWVVVQKGPLYWQEKIFVYHPDKLISLLERSWERMEKVFSIRNNWSSDLRLSIHVEMVEDDSNAEETLIKDWFSQKGIQEVLVDFIRIDLPSHYTGLIESFTNEVRHLCSQERDIVSWGRFEEDIILAGIEGFRENLARQR